jgi:2-haloacid dehalogenase
MTAIDTVVFDVGNVLIPWDPRWLLRKLLPDDDAVEHFLRESDFLAWNAQHDAGQTFADGIAQQARRFPQWRHLFQAFFDRWEETTGPPIAETLALSRALRAAGYRTLALTNFSAETWPRAVARFAFLGEFEGVVVSGHERLMKPDPAIYRLLCERHAVEPSRAVFIDDSLHNVDGARRIGMAALHYTSPAALLDALAALGVRGAAPSRHGSRSG